MHIAYSALQDNKRRNIQTRVVDADQLNLRFKAYQLACNKYSKEIAEIQKYLPGWVPAYPIV